MTSNAKTMLQGLLSLVVVSWASGAYAQNLETPGAPAAEAATAAATAPTGFGDGGQFVLSFENMFGYNWDHVSLPNGSVSSNAYSILGQPFSTGGLGGAAGAYPYDWPRLGFDYFPTKSISAGISAAFARFTTSGASANAYVVAPRLGYGMMVGPWLGVWPRLGVSYVGATNLKYLGISIDLQAVAVVNPHFIVTFAPIANIGVYGKAGNANEKFTTLGAMFGFGIPF